MADTTEVSKLAIPKKLSVIKKYSKQRYLFFLLAFALVWTIIFRYGPMYGVIIAFKKYRIFDGIWGSQWVGLANFVRFVRLETVESKTVFVGVNRDGANAEFVGRPKNSNRDFGTVGDEQFANFHLFGTLRNRA